MCCQLGLAFGEHGPLCFQAAGCGGHRPLGLFQLPHGVFVGLRGSVGVLLGFFGAHL